MRNRVLILAAAALAPFTAASSQQLAAPSNVFSIQPLNAMFTAYSAEYERKIGAAATVGVAARTSTSATESTR